MTLPTANCSFTIPSVHNDIELDCRLYYPQWTEKNAPIFGKGFAILAHPYASLGGTYDDPVLAVVGALLLQHGFTLGTFNFRGAGNSAGRTSWTGQAELADYVSFYAFMLCCVGAVSSSREEELGQPDTGRPLLLLGGYSYGSMIASHLPSVDTVVKLVQSPTPGSAESEIKLRAQHLSRDLKAHFEVHTDGPLFGQGQSGEDSTTPPSRSVVMGGYESSTASRRIGRESSRRSLDGEKLRDNIERVRQKLKSRITSEREAPGQESEHHEPAALALSSLRLAYLLISPLLPPIASFTTMFSTPRFTRARPHSRQSDAYSESGRMFAQLVDHPCCCIYGSKDVFTSHSRLQKWTNDLRHRAGSKFTVVQVEAGHFWQEPGSINALRTGLSSWLQAWAGGVPY